MLNYMKYTSNCKETSSIDPWYCTSVVMKSALSAVGAVLCTIYSQNRKTAGEFTHLPVHFHNYMYTTIMHTHCWILIQLNTEHDTMYRVVCSLYNSGAELDVLYTSLHIFPSERTLSVSGVPNHDVICMRIYQHTSTFYTLQFYE